MPFWRSDGMLTAVGGRKAPEQGSFRIRRASSLIKDRRSQSLGRSPGKQVGEKRGDADRGTWRESGPQRAARYSSKTPWSGQQVNCLGWQTAPTLGVRLAK